MSVKGQALDRTASRLGRPLTGQTPVPTATPNDQKEAASQRGFVCFSAQDWWYHNQAHSDFQLMKELSRHEPVLVVNSITMRMPLPGRTTMVRRRILRKARSMARLLRSPLPELPNFWVMTPLFLPVYGSERARTLNAAFIRWQVQSAARRLGMRHPACVVTMPTALDVVRGMDVSALIVNRSDKYSALPEANGKTIREMEIELLKTADVVLYVSRALMRDELRYTGDRAHFLDHGVDLEHFRRRPAADEPDDIRRIPHPRIGFFGGFDDYIVDLGLLERVARDLPDAHLILIGDATCPMGRLTALPNVHWLGPRPYQDIPAYGSAFDVALMPWVQNEWIAHCNPIKMKEYLALGLPIVSTPFEEVSTYAGLIDVAESAEEFVAAVGRHLTAGRSVGAESRRSAVLTSSWSSRADVIRSLSDAIAQNR